MLAIVAALAGLAVVSSTSISGFTQPVAFTVDSSGVLYVAEKVRRFRISTTAPVQRDALVSCFKLVCYRGFASAHRPR